MPIAEKQSAFLFSSASEAITPYGGLSSNGKPSAACSFIECPYSKPCFLSTHQRKEVFFIIIFVIVYGRMIEIYCMVSLAPIPMATWGNHEQSHMGQNYLKCLFALGFQGFLILICVAIYAVLIQSVAISGDAINSIWNIVGYTVLLCFSLFKTSSVTKSVLGAH